MKWLAAFFLLAAPAHALDLSVSGGSVIRTEETPAGQIRLPDGPWKPGAPASVASGAISVFASNHNLGLLVGERRAAPPSRSPAARRPPG